MFSWGLIIALVLLALFILLFTTLGDGLLKEAAQAVGTDGETYSVLPNSRRSLLGGTKGKPAYVPERAHFFNFKQGFDISLLGEPSMEHGIQSVRGKAYAIRPQDIIGMSPIPKLLVEVGTHVKAGDGLFFDKQQPEVIYAAPVSGELVEVRRGEKRMITELVILADQDEIKYRPFQAPNLATASREEVIEFLLESGAWPFIRQRPYDVVASPKRLPKSIFISTFDTAPLAPNLNLAVEGKEAEFQAGLDALRKLTDGLVHLGLDARSDKAPAAGFTQAKGVAKHWFKGPHPAGNVGVHIHHIDPINSGEVVWTLDVHAVITIGTLFTKGIFDAERLVALVGAELEKPRYVRVHQGISMADLGINDLVKVVAEDEQGRKVTKLEKNGRIISGDPLTGNKETPEGFLHFYDDQVTVIREGNYHELFGWLLPQKGHPTISRTFPGGFFPDAKYVADTNTNGEHRAFVVSGQYESVLPMDILPQYLFRAILANDLEQMEGLGILELSEEDVALCEYVCTSKQQLQQMLRDGLDLMRAQEA